MNVLIKLLYFAANLVTFLGLNNVLNKEFIHYGTEWSKWTVLDNHIAYDYMGLRGFPKPGWFVTWVFGGFLSQVGLLYGSLGVS